MPKKPKNLIIYHANCIDGFTAAYITAKFMDTEDQSYELFPAEYTKDTYDKIEARVSELDTSLVGMFIVDFSLPVDLLQHLRDTYPNLHIMLLDHHKTALEEYSPISAKLGTSKLAIADDNLYIEIDMDKCGAEIAWSRFFDTETMPDLITYVGDYDLWKFEQGDATRYVNKYLKEVPQTVEAWDSVCADLQDPVGSIEIMASGKSLHELHVKEVDEYVEAAELILFEDHMVYMVSCPSRFASDVGHILADRTGTFSVTSQVLEKKGDTGYKYSLRSVGDFDVQEIAKKYGGGGHKNAAGMFIANDRLKGKLVH